jgi:hypothetical protein
MNFDCGTALMTSHKRQFPDFCKAILERVGVPKKIVMFQAHLLHQVLSEVH